jgi:glycogen debranching enzyme
VAGEVIILDGLTFFSSRENGDVDPAEAEGYFYHDVRHLSTWCLLLDGETLKAITSRRVQYFAARIECIPRDCDDAPPVRVRRDRFISEGVHEDVVVTNLTDDAQRVRLELRFGSDFADVVEAQEGSDGGGRNWTRRSARGVTLWEQRDGYRRGTRITFNRQCRIERGRAIFSIRVPPHRDWELCVDVTPVVDGSSRPPLLRCGSFDDHAPKMPVGLHEWIDDAPKLETSNDSLQHIYRQSLLDLAALRVRPDNVELEKAMLGGGIPWYIAVFGRDSIIAAYQALPFRADLAEATLEALAELQATEWDNFRDAEPGKILHELRRGVLAALGQIPHSPYYGTHDATLLWLILLDEYERWTGDRRLVRALEPNARAAIEWLDGPADLDGDGYLEYRKRSDGRNALDNHCWKDSSDGIVFPDGRRAEPPIATCEIQGYAFDARRRCARLAREVWRDDALADRLERAAVELQRRFNRDFWDARRRCYVLALDGDKRQVDSVTSNIGHLLWSGIVDERRARAVARHLLSGDLFSGWGVRTLSAEHPTYNPLAYHRGTVWPHDTAIVAEGLRRYGFRDEAAKVCAALFDAAVAFDNELPEVFGGFARDATRTTVEYPDALRPQAWASGAPLLMLRTLLGLDVEDGRLRSHPHVPESIGRIRLRGLRVRGRKVDTR